MFRRLRQTLSNLRRNFIYFCQQDYRRAHDHMLAAGRRIERDAPNDLRHCPVCEAELQRTTRLNGEIVSFCPRWQFHPAETQPRVRQVPFPDVERFTDKLTSTTTVPLPGQGLRMIHQAIQDGRSPHTAVSQAIPKPRLSRPQ